MKSNLFFVCAMFVLVTTAGCANSSAGNASPQVPAQTSNLSAETLDFVTAHATANAPARAAARAEKAKWIPSRSSWETVVAEGGVGGMSKQAPRPAPPKRFTSPTATLGVITPTPPARNDEEIQPPTPDDPPEITARMMPVPFGMSIDPLILFCLDTWANVRMTLMCEEAIRQLNSTSLAGENAQVRDVLVDHIVQFNIYHESVVAKRQALLPLFVREIGKADQFLIDAWGCDWGYPFGNDPFDFPWQKWADFVDNPQDSLPRAIVEFHTVDCLQLSERRIRANEVIALLGSALN